MTTKLTLNRTAVQLKLAAAASPRRVAQAAQMFADALNAAAENLPGESVTMVVKNYSTTAGIRPRTAEGRDAVEQVLATLSNPIRAAKRNPQCRAVATILAQYAREVKDLDARFLRPSAKQPLARVDDEFIQTLELAAQTPEHSGPVFRGSTSVVTVVYRVGRADDGKAIAVRLKINGAPHEVPVVTKGDVGPFFDAAKRGTPVRVHLKAEWRQDKNGTLLFNEKRTRAIRVDLDWKPMSGRTFLAALAEHAPAFGELDLDAIHRERGSGG